MQSDIKTVDQYFDSLPEDRKPAMTRLRQVIKDNLPEGFTEEMSYGLPGYVVPHALYPAGYHCDPKLPLPFVSIASQKNFIAVYHMGVYADPKILDWFASEFPKHSKAKLDMGKSCIRFKKPENIPFELIGELMKKMSVKDWIGTYEMAFRRK
ncbi:DUF1801 domain-containing protein [Daejeonella lutea]|uniref:YdhG-like domain-containing protein n=1 Tax=Daejeonella lutea TaxID=572036 RepID=A0A1T4ZX39_9SPHI|nr:DUF1801 domain-containing protein [Daejeonella lutea]SKB27276.1 protein of unknown function (DU1801) [Daejeonella lutea]